MPRTTPGSPRPPPSSTECHPCRSHQSKWGSLIYNSGAGMEQPQWIRDGPGRIEPRALGEIRGEPDFFSKNYENFGVPVEMRREPAILTVTVFCELFCIYFCDTGITQGQNQATKSSIINSKILFTSTRCISQDAPWKSQRICIPLHLHKYM